MDQIGKNNTYMYTCIVFILPPKILVLAITLMVLTIIDQYFELKRN